MIELPSRSDRIVVMGVLNVTPDSFSDGGRYTSVEDAVTHAVAMRAVGADLVDVGGESTRPGAQRVEAAEETRRILPVIKALAALDVPISVDTYRASVAAAAIGAGATVVNDVSGGLGDVDMARVVRDAGCPWVLMHWRGHSASMQQLAHYDNVVAEVRDELSARVDAALAAGVDAGKIVLDPGLGFAKTAAQVVPRPPAGRRGRGAPARRRAGGRDDGVDCVRGAARSVGGAGARRPAVGRCGTRGCRDQAGPPCVTALS
jgi:dihydropteroate synthase